MTIIEYDLDTFVGRLTRSRVFFIWYLPPPIGGISAIAQRLSERHVHCTFAPTDFFIRYDIISFCVSLWTIFKHDYIILHGVSLRSLVWAIVSWLLRKKTILMEHNQKTLGKNTLLYKCMREVIYTVCGRIFFVCGFSADVMRATKFGTKVRKVDPYIPIADSNFKLNQTAKKISEEEGLVFGVSCYKFIEHNGCDFYGITDAVKILRENFPGSLLVIVSPDSEIIRKKLQELKEDKELMIQYYDSSYPLTTWLPAFDVFFRLPVSDGFGLSVFEALQAGCKVIATPAESRLNIDKVYLIDRKERYYRDPQLINFVCSK